jgi:hypothetical protein
MSRTLPWCAWLSLLAVCGLGSGCVDRRFVITSDPPTAVVEMNSQPVSGATPADVQFTYYGTYHFVLKHEGFETLVVEQPVRPPWYEIPPLDFVSENVIPWTIRDVRRLHFPMRPLQIVPPEAVLDRANQMREAGRKEGKPPRNKPAPAPAPAVVPAVVAPAVEPAPGPAVTPVPPANPATAPQ